MKRERTEEGFRNFSGYVEETGLFADLKAICLRHHVTLRDVYLDTKGPTVYAARLEVWWWLYSTIKKSTFEIARLFDRDDSTISYALIKLRARATELGHVLEDNVHDTARAIAERTTRSRAVSMSKNRKTPK